jgi:hypothetical protein
MRKKFSSAILQHSVCLFACSVLANGVSLAQTTMRPPAGGGPVTIGSSTGKGPMVSTLSTNGTAPDGKSLVTTGSGFGLAINGSDVGSILLQTCDLDQGGTVTPAELKTVAAACLKLWDANGDGSLSTDELSAGLKKLLPAPPSGAQGVAVVNGVQVSPDQLPTPDKQLTKHILALADANKDGLISLQELNDYLGKSFSQWDHNGNGSLDVQELGSAFTQLATPDLPR